MAHMIKNSYYKAYALNDMGNSYSGSKLDSALHFLKTAGKIWDTLRLSQKGYNLMYTAEAYFASGPEYYNDAEKYFMDT